MNHEMYKLAENILCNLIRLDTSNPPGNEKIAAIYLQKLLTSEVILCEVQDLGSNRANILAQVGNGTGPVLLFNGHLDEVCAVADEWSCPPFDAVIKDGSCYGRGSCDMKAGIAAMCAAAIFINKKYKDLSGTLKLVFVADEEDANLGMHSYLKDNSELPDYAIIGEPTENRIAIAHKGSARYYIDLHGESQHSALPIAGESSVVQAAKVVLALEKWNKELQNQVHEVLSPPSLAITKIEGYEKDNIIPSKTRLLIDYRVLPGTTEEEACRQLDKVIGELGVNYSLIKHFFIPGGMIAADHWFVNTCRKSLEKLSGTDNEPIAFRASCEQCFLGQAGVNTVICGPGSLQQAHGTDEYVSLKQLYDAADFYYSIAEKISVRGEHDE